MGQPKLHETRAPATPDSPASPAIVFIHGFGGETTKTWGEFPNLLRDEPALSEWGIYCLGYSSKLMPDLRGVWSGDPGISTLATYLRTRAMQDPLKGRKLALIAHSMGGLVVQEALVTHPELVDRTSHVLLFGTPSGGLRKASGFWARLFKRQTQDMGLSGTFIPELRAAWRERFGDREHPPTAQQAAEFGFWSIAGDRDEFVPARSSLGPFADEHALVVPGNHLEIVKPSSHTSMSVRAAVDAIVGKAAPGGPWNSARVAVEMGDFQEAIRRFEDHRNDLDEPSAVELALAYDAVGRRDDAVEVLRVRTGKGGTDALGTLAGRFKRVWWSNGTESNARRALELYRKAFEQAKAADDVAQAFYNGINLAFMKRAYERDVAGARALATEVLDFCGRVPEQDVWCVATIGEAHLQLGEAATALEAYRRAVAMEPEPWQMKSMYMQARRIADAIDDPEAGAALRPVFGFDDA